jgi:hypothetical protein
MTDERPRESYDSVGDPAPIHQLTGENEQRYGKKYKRMHTGKRALYKSSEHFYPTSNREIDEWTKRKRKNDRYAE